MVTVVAGARRRGLRGGAGMEAGLAGLTEALSYSRVSKDEMAREGLSLPAQVGANRRYATEQGWGLGREFQDVLQGTRDDRPDYQALLAEARRLTGLGVRVVVVVPWLHRLGRRLQERVNSRAELKALGVETHSVHEGGLVSDLVANILASVAEEEVRQLGERIRGVNDHTRDLGWRVPGRCPWGYRWRPATEAERREGAPKAVLEPAPQAAAAVAEAFARVASGESVRRVALRVATLPDEARGGRVLNFARVRLALRSPVYAGLTEPDAEGTLHPGRWPALVDVAVWEAVQARFASHQRVPHQASGAYLLTGLLRCPVCGCRMGGRRGRVEGQAKVEGEGPVKGHPTRARYVCCSAMLGTKAVDAVAVAAEATGASVAPSGACHFSVNMPAIDGAVRGAVAPLEAVLLGPALAAPTGALGRAWEALRAPVAPAPLRAQVKRLEAQRQREVARLVEAGASLADSDDPLDKLAYDGVKARVRGALAGLDADLQALRGAITPAPDLPPLAEALAVVGALRGAFAAGDVPAQREALGRLLERVVPVRIRPGAYALDEAKTAWTPLGEALQEVSRRLAP